MNCSEKTILNLQCKGIVHCQDIIKTPALQIIALTNYLSSSFQFVEVSRFFRWLVGLHLFAVILISGFTSSATAATSVNGNWRNTTENRIQVEVNGTQTFSDQYADFSYNFGESSIDDIDFVAADVTQSSTRLRRRRVDNDDFNATTGVVVFYMSYGVWRISKNRCASGTCYGSAQFTPNFDAIRRSVFNADQTVTAKIEIRIYASQQRRISKTISVEFVDEEDIYYTWYSNEDKEIFFDESNSRLPRFSGRIYAQQSTLSLQYKGIETINSGPPTTIVGTNSSNNHSYTITQQFGSWAISPLIQCLTQFCQNVTFTPNASAINGNLSLGKKIVASLNISNLVNGSTTESKTLTVTIYGKPGISGTWSSRTEPFISIANGFLNVGPEINITTNGHSLTNPILAGSMSVFYNKNYTMQFSAKEYFDLAGTEQIGNRSGLEARTFSGRTRNVRQYGNNFLYGKWVVEAETYGTSTTNATSGEHKFWFEIDNSSIANIAFGNRILYTLVVSFLDSDNNVIDSTNITVRIIRPHPKPTLSFVNGSSSPLTIDEGDEIEIKVTLDQFPTAPIDVTISQHDIGIGRGFVGTFSTNPVSIGASGTATTTFTAGIENSHDSDGTLDLRVASSPSLSNSNSKLTLAVTNHSHPTLSITSISDQSSVAEGDDITIKLSAFPRPTTDLTVNLVSSEHGEGVGFLSPQSTKPVIGTSGVLEWVIPTNTVTSHDDEGNITIELGDSDYYEINTHLNQITVAVDNTRNSEIAIINAPNTVMEGQTISFQLQATPVPDESLEIALEITESPTNHGYVRSKSFTNSATMTTSGLVDVTIDTNVLLAAIGAGEITISIAEGKRYFPSELNSVKTVAVTKDPTAVIPEVSIVFSGQQSQITEGDDLEFSIRAIPSPTRPLSVQFEFAETASITGYLVDDQKLSPVSIGTNGVANLTIETNKQIANESDGEITITLLAQPTYTVSSSENELEIAIQNVPIPVISIESVNDGEVVEEGINYLFKLTASPAPTNDLAVNLSMNGGDTGHYRGILASIQVPPIFVEYGTVTIPTSGTISVTVLNRYVSNSVRHGQIAISISPVEDKSYAIHQTKNRIATLIKDSVDPKISITSDFHNNHVIEGEEFSFQLVANPAPVSPLNVELNVVDSGIGHFLGLANGNTVTIGTDGLLEITEQTTRVGANQTDGQIDITIVSSGTSSYTKSSNSQSIQIKVLDTTPVVSIESEMNSQSIQEGDNFPITLSAYPLSSSITVALTPTNQINHFLSYSTGASVTINPSGDDLRGETEITVNTRVLSNLLNGEIEIRVSPSSNASYKLSTIHNVVTVAVKDSTLPTVAISSAANGTSITEGENFTFTLTSTPAQTSNLEVEYFLWVSNEGHLGTLTIENPATTVISDNSIPLGTSGSRVVTVSTNNVTATKAHSTITITVVSRTSSDYVVAPTAGRIDVRIKDAVKPVVTITSNKDGSYINEGGQFEFTLTATPTPIAPISVPLTVGDNGSHHFKSMSENFPIEIGTDGMKVITVRTYQIERVQRGEVNISLDPVNSNTAYQLSLDSAEQSVRVLVRDRVTPVVSIQVPSKISTIIEGQSYTFNLVSTPAPVSPISIDLEVNDGGSGHFANLSTTGPVVIGESGTTQVTVNTRLVNNIQQHGNIGILITTKSTRDFKVSQTQNLIRIGIVDKVKPVVSISLPRSQQVLTEGEDYMLHLSAKPRPYLPISVSLTGMDQGSGHYSALPNNGVVEIGLTGTTSISATTINNTIKKGNGQIDIALAEVSSSSVYTINPLAAKKKIGISIAESQPSVISISSNLAGKSVVEGESFNVTLTADVAPLLPIQVSLQANDLISGHFVNFTPASPVSMVNTKTLTVAVGTQVVTGIAHGLITVSLPPPAVVSYSSSAEDSSSDSQQLPARTVANYTVHSENFSVQVGIRDSVKPVVSIDSTASVVTEGQSFEFTLTATPAPYAPIMVALTAGDAGTGHFVSLSESSPVEITGGTKKVSVTTQVLSAVAHGEINVAINVSSNAYYQSATADADRILSVTIKDSQAPVVSITSNKHNLSIIEGETFTVRLETVPTPIDNIAVELEITQGTTGHFNRLSTSSPVTVTNSGVVDITVHTNSTTTRELGQLGIAVVSRDANVYGKSSTAGAISVKVKDAVKSVISISSTKHNGVVNEGESFSFRLSATPVPLEAFMVDITAADSGTGHLGVLSDPDPVEIGTNGIVDVSVTTLADSTNVRHGVIDITLDDVTSQDYEVSSTQANKAIQVKIKDLVKPVISISSIKNGQIITEGDSIEFSLVASLVPVVPISVELDIGDGELGHFKNIAPTAPITISGTDPVAVTLSTNNTSTAVQGLIQVAINEGNRTNYQASTTANSISVKIKDTVKPVVSIATTQLNNIVTEGSPFNFTLSSIPAPIAPILIDISATDGGTSHLGSIANQVEIGTSGSKSVTVPTLADLSLVRHGLITIALTEVSNADYVVTTTSTAQAIKLKVRDQVVPVVSITSEQNNLSIIEGNSFTIRLTSVPAPVSDIAIELAITEGTTGHFNRLSQNSPVTLSDTGVTDITVFTNSTTTRELGQLGIAIVSNDITVYKMSTTAGSVSVGVKDAIKSVITISSNQNNGVVNEGDSFSFRLSANPVPLEAIMVDLTATDSGTGHLGVLSDPTPVEIGTSGTTDVSVSTISDAINVRHGLIDIVLDDIVSQDYKLTTNTSEKAIQVKIKDLVKPVISISSTRDGQIITEGDSFSFSLEASFAPVVPISVDLAVSDGELGHIKGLTPSAPITITDTNPVRVTLTTNDTTTAEQGQIQVMINEGDRSNYTAATLAKDIQVKIKDTVKPVVSITSTHDNGAVTEGISFSVTFSAIPAPITPIMVDITGTNSDTNHLGTLVNQVEIDTSGTKSITVPTLIEANEVRHGNINISLDEVTNASYEITTTLAEQEINVIIRDQVTPVVSITSAHHNKSIIEGETFNFRLEAKPTPIDDILVELELTTGTTGHFNRLSQSSPVTMTNSGVVDLTVYTNSTTTRQLGEIGIAVVSNDATIYGKSSSAGVISVGIKDAIKSVISISSVKHNDFVTEGDSFGFRLTATPVPLAPIFVDVTATDSGTGHLGLLSDASPVEIGTGGVADVSVATIAANASIEHGVIDISVDEMVNQDYEVTTITANKAVQVKIKDNVNPVISISSTYNDQIITEGGDFEFNVQASFAPVAPISIALDVGDGGLGHFNYLSPTAPISINGADPVTVTLSTNNTSSTEQGQIEVSINEGDGSDYTASTSTHSIQVKIRDSVNPVISITSTQNNQIISEGADFEFSLEASFAPIAPISVALDISDRGLGHFNNLVPTAPISISGTDPVTVTLSTNNTTSTEQGQIEVAINEGDGSDYSASTSTHSIQVKIRDSVNPVISISSTQNNQIISEGGNFEFSLEASFAPIAPISVALDISDGGLGHFHNLVPTAPISISGTDPVPVTLSTNNTTSAEQGQIQLSINEGDGSDYTASTSTHSIQVKIKDSIKPVVSIASTQHQGIITEGSSFEITLSANPAPISPILVAITGVDKGTNHLGTLVNQVEIGTSGTKLITVPTLTDVKNIQHGEIEISLNDVSNSDYEISSVGSEQMVQVKIRDQVDPVVSITSSHHDGRIIEGASFEFSLTANPEPLTPITVELEIDDTSKHFSRLSQSGPIIINNAVPVVLTLFTKSTNSHEKGRIRIAVVENEQSINIQSNSNTPAAIIVDIADAITPVVAISSKQNNEIITEGETISFTLIAEPAPHTPIMVAMIVTDSADHLISPSLLNSVEIDTTGRKTISLPTIVDSKTIQHGNVVISLNTEGSPNYAVSLIDAQRSIQVTIKDEVKPVVSINSKFDGDSIVEGANFSFQVSVNPQPVVPIMVNLEIDDKNLGHFNRFSVATPIQLSTSNPIEVIALTNVVYSAQNQGKITVSAVRDERQDYLISPTNNVVSVAIRDAEKPTVSLIIPNTTTPVLEGEKIHFQLQANPAPLTPIQVEVIASDQGTGHFVQVTENGLFTIETDGIANGTIVTRNNLNWRGHGKITIEVNNGPTYNLSDESNSVEIVVLDQEMSELPEIFVSAPSVINADQESFDITFTAIPASSTGIELAFQVFQSSDLIQWRIPKSIVLRDTKTVSLHIQDNLNSETENSISLLIMESPNYITNLSLVNVEIVSRDNAVQNEEPEGQARISVASLVANQLSENVLEHTEQPVQGESSIGQLPIVSIEAVSETVQEGEKVRFLISSTQAINDLVYLDLQETGDFLVDKSIEPFAMVGRNNVVFELETINDEAAELDGMVSMTLNEGLGYLLSADAQSATITILDSTDQVNQRKEMIATIESILPEINQTEQELLNSSITNRMQFSNSDRKASYFNLGGHQNITDLIQGTGELVQHNADLTHELLNGSNFEINLFPSIGLYSPISMWGQLQFHTLDSVNVGNEEYSDGELIANQYGIDAQLSPTWIAGVGGLSTQVELDRASQDISRGLILTSSNQLNPYLGWSSVDSNSYFRTIFGIGVGELVISPTGLESKKFDTRLISLALEGSIELFSRSLKKTKGDTTLKISGNTNFSNQIVKMDAGYENDITVKTGSTRIALEGEHSFGLGNGTLIKPKSSIGFQAVNSTIKDPILYNLTGGIELSMASGLELIGEGIFQNSQFDTNQKWQFKSSLDYDFDQDDLGLMLNLASESCSGCKSNTLYDFEFASVELGARHEFSNKDLHSQTSKISGEVGYGFELGDDVGIWQPFVGFDVTTSEFNQQRIGSRVTTNSNFDFEFVGIKNQSHLDEDFYQLMFSGNLSW